ncbi:MAG: hypothetical protein P8129_11905 [Anaerolineae bacterium]
MDERGNVESIKGGENVLGTPYPDELTGNWNPNSLFGRAGDDVNSGMSGNDVLRGGLSSDNVEGGDYLDGGAGDDALYGNDDPRTDDASPEQIVGSVGTDTGHGTALDYFWPSTETIVPCSRRITIRRFRQDPRIGVIISGVIRGKCFDK